MPQHRQSLSHRHLIKKIKHVSCRRGVSFSVLCAEKYPQYNIKLSRALYHNLLSYEGRALIKKRTIDNSKAEDILTNLYDEDRTTIMSILESEGCIPQEALNYDDMKVTMDELQYRLF